MLSWLKSLKKAKILSSGDVASLPAAQVHVAAYAPQAWRGEASLLLALDKGEVPVRSSCRSGNCGTCVAYLKSGEVGYTKEITFPLEEGEILMCSCVPKSDLYLELPAKPVGSRRGH